MEKHKFVCLMEKLLFTLIDLVHVSWSTCYILITEWHVLISWIYHISTVLDWLQVDFAIWSQLYIPVVKLIGLKMCNIWIHREFKSNTTNCTHELEGWAMSYSVFI